VCYFDECSTNVLYNHFTSLFQKKGFLWKSIPGFICVGVHSVHAYRQVCVHIVGFIFEAGNVVKGYS